MQAVYDPSPPSQVLMHPQTEVDFDLAVFAIVREVGRIKVLLDHKQLGEDKLGSPNDACKAETDTTDDPHSYDLTTKDRWWAGWVDVIGSNAQFVAVGIDRLEHYE